MYISDLPLSINSLSEPVLFADDTNVISNRIFEDLCSVSNLVLSRMNECCAANNAHAGHLLVNKHLLSLSPVFSIHDISVTDLIRNFELPEDGAGLAPKHVGAAITF
jgi:hypothetical protein